MFGWYSVSYVGWIVTSVHTALTAFVIHGLWFYDLASEEIEFFHGAVYMHIILVVILLYARRKKMLVFKKERAKK